MVLKYLIEKEFKQIVRNPILTKLILVYPILMFGLFPWAITFEIKNIHLTIVDESRDACSISLVEKINASPYFKVQQATSYRNALENMDRHESDLILHIPSAFARDMVRENGSSVFLASNAVDGTQGLLGASYLQHIIRDFATQWQAEGQGGKQNMTPVLKIMPTYRYNPNLDYKFFVLPGFIALIITLICGILPTLNIVLEKENGTIQQINATPVSKMQFIIAKLIPYWIIGLITLTLSLLLVWGIFGLAPVGHVWTIYVVSFIFILAISGLGLIISNHSQTLQQAAFLAMFLILVIILLSGLFTSVSAMPTWAKWIAYANPLTYFMDTLRLIYLKGSGLRELWRPLIAMGGFVVLLNAWAMFSYKKIH